MEAVILAAGKGTRLAPITHTVPKAMVPVNGRPMLEIILEQVKSAGITDVCIVVYYLKEQIINYFGDGSRFGMNIRYAEQQQIDGSAKAVLLSRQYVLSDRFLCIAADSLFETNLLERLLRNRANGVFACKEVEDGRRYGILVTDGAHVKRVIEKPDVPPTNLANFSVYVLPREIYSACERVSPGKGGEYWITDAIQLLIDSGKTFGYEKSEHILDVGTPASLEEAQVLAKKLGI